MIWDFGLNVAVRCTLRFVKMPLRATKFIAALRLG